MKNKNIINFLQNILKNISLGIGCMFLLTVVFSLLLQVILRYFFRTAVPWAEEVSRYSVIWLVLITANVLIMDDELIKVDFFVKFWPKKLVEYRDNVYNILFIFIFIIFIKEGWLMALAGRAQRLTGLISVGIDVRFFFPYLSIPIGATLMLIQLLIIIFKNFGLITNKRK